jgi:hypothetical protein
MPVIFSNVVQRSVNDANNDLNLNSATTAVDHTLVHILGVNGVGGGGNIAQSRTLYLDLTNLTESSVIDATQDYLVFYDTSSGNHYKIKIQDLVSSGIFQYVKYIDNNCTIIASNTGITVTKSSGTISVTIPENVHLISLNITGELADLDPYANLYVEFVHQMEVTINQDLDSAVVPIMTYINTTFPVTLNGGVVSEDFPAQYDPNKTYNLVECGLDGTDAILKIKIESIVDDHFIIKLNF